MLPATNPFAMPSDLPHQLPPFDAIGEEHHRPALLEGMAVQRAEVEAIATDSREPTFAGVVEALERSGALLGRVSAVFSTLVGAHSTPALRDLEAEVAPLLADHRDAILLDARLFARLDTLHARRAQLGLDGEQLAVLERYHRDFVRGGAALPLEEQGRLRALNAELAQLTTAFGAAMLAESNDLAVHLDDPALLAGLDEGEVAGAAQAARDRGLGGHLLPLVLPTDQPVLARLADRSVRERVFTASTSRGARGGEHDTRELVSRTTALRAQRAALLGAASHAEHVVADQTAGTVGAVMDVLTSLVPAAVANAEREAAELEAALVADGGSLPLRPWDWAYYAERVRAERVDLDPAALRPYFALDDVVTRGVFAAATGLYGVTFTERPELPTYHPDVRTWEVLDADGTSLGLFLGDYFARESKRGGAWMNNLVEQSRLLGTRPVVVNTLNVPKPAPGQPALLTPDQVETAFHEFGHALHGLLSDVELPRLSGTTVPRDFVEYPSQVNEVWAWDPAVLPGYARHWSTGEPLPGELVAKLLASRADGQGFATTEILAAMLLDQAWHALAAGTTVAAADVEAFEARALAEAGIALELVPPRYRSTYFNHVFAGGYSAGYYSYLWSEVLDADTVEWFGEQARDDGARDDGARDDGARDDGAGDDGAVVPGSLLRRASGEVFRRELLSRGGTVDPMTAYRAFRGREPRIDPLLVRRALAPA